MPISPTMPAITHVAVTVSDIARSVEWYTKVLGVAPVLDEDTGPFRHIVYQIGGTLFGLRPARRRQDVPSGPACHHGHLRVLV